MSRGTVTKSRTDKKGGQSVPLPAVAHEIIPGKYTDQDWNSMLEKDDGEDFIADIVEDVVAMTLEKAYDGYISRQLLPFTINQAKDAILQIIEWQFLAHDEGDMEVDKDPGWIQEEEPDPATTDCWAQGSVPKIFLPPVCSVIEEEPEVKEEAQPTETVDPEICDEQMSDQVSEPPLPENTQLEEDQPQDANFVPENSDSPTKAAASPKKKRRGYKPHYGSLKSAGVSRMTESLEDTEIQLWEKEARENLSPERPLALSLIQMPVTCHSLLKEPELQAHSYHYFVQGLLKTSHSLHYSSHGLVAQVHSTPSVFQRCLIDTPFRHRMQQGRPPGNKEVTYDEMGNVVAVVKLNPDRLPNHRVKVGYHVVDPTVEAAEARLDAMKKGKLTRKNLSHKEPKHSNGKRASVGSSTVTSKGKPSVLTDSQSKTPLPPAMIDTVDIAPGVVIREGQQVRKGPRRVVKKSNQLTDETQRMLKPISICNNLATLDVSEILERRTPTLKPLAESNPIPPINPHPPQQPRVS
ncbi:uncharacterized protein C2orf81 homolog isoform X1 [Liolophura sinensis]|uniref:uncharacterized protein C2orf81 homolog isoform X1 n=1 Tax=Liolophura sinensis TaxID=3198878 RepID=UPI0031585924